MLTLICFIVLAQAYLFKWIIPAYHLIDKKVTEITPDMGKGYAYLLALAVILILLSFFILTRVRKKTAPDIL